MKVQKLLCFLNIAYHSTEWIWNAVAFSTVLGAGLLHDAIPNFYFVTSHKTKFGLIATYTIAFALCGLLINAKRSEIFSACAAVIVILVSSNSGNSTASTYSSSASCGRAS